MALASFEQILYLLCCFLCSGFLWLPWALAVLRLSWRCHGGCAGLCALQHMYGGQRQLVRAGSLLLFGSWDSNSDFQAWPQACSPLSQLTDSCFSFKICGISSLIELKWCVLGVLIQCLLQINDLIESPCNELRARNSLQCFYILLRREYSLVT